MVYFSTILIFFFSSSLAESLTELSIGAYSGDQGDHRPEKKKRKNLEAAAS
jgi:hypothetical protein